MRAIFQIQAFGGLYLEGRFNGGFFALLVLGAYFRNFTVAKLQWHGLPGRGLKAKLRVNLATVRSNRVRTRVVPVNSKAARGGGGGGGPVNSKAAHPPPPPPRAYSGHLTGLLLRTVGNVTQNEARPLGQLTFASGMLCTPRLCVYGSLLLHSLFLVAFSWSI